MTKHIGSSQQIIFPALSEMHSISHPQISQKYVLPFSAFAAFLVLADFGFSAFDSVFLDRISPLDFHQEEAVDSVDFALLVVGMNLPPLII
jgi:hypothetical protein